MPVKVTWDNDEKTIIRTEAQGKWSWEEYHDGTRQVFDLMKAVNHDIIGIINYTHSGSSLPKGNPMPHFNRTL